MHRYTYLLFQHPEDTIKNILHISDIDEAIDKFIELSGDTLDVDRAQIKTILEYDSGSIEVELVTELATLRKLNNYNIVYEEK